AVQDRVSLQSVEICEIKQSKKANSQLEETIAKNKRQSNQNFPE
ncbi:3004_t:CDS:2, partial [Dentiscutata heterogama]